ncbi:MAG: hypothetical protein KDD25_02795 [Bdellovibrionales bacterium]|nr:hypothetical protein [Bdellovibrionales bacterium]
MKKLILAIVLLSTSACGIRADFFNAEKSPLEENAKEKKISAFGGDYGFMQPNVASIFVWPSSDSDLDYVKEYGIRPTLAAITEEVVYKAHEIDDFEIQIIELDNEPETRFTLDVFNEYTSLGCDFLPEDEERCNQLTPLVTSLRSKKTARDTELNRLQGERDERKRIIERLLDSDPDRPVNYLLSDAQNVGITIQGRAFEFYMNGFGPDKVNYSSKTGDVLKYDFNRNKRYLDFTVREKVPRGKLEESKRRLGLNCLSKGDLADNTRDMIRTCRNYEFELELNGYPSDNPVKTRISGSFNIVIGKKVVRRGSAKFDGVFVSR